MMIPHSRSWQHAAQLLSEELGVMIYDNALRLRNFDRRIRLLFGQGFFRSPGNLRKQLCWLGPFDRFLYLDADIVVFERIASLLSYLQDYDFLCYSDQHLGGLQHVFKEEIVRNRIFDRAVAWQIFNAGFWGGRKQAFDETRLFRALAQCAQDKRYLDRSLGGSDQPVFNYIMLKSHLRQINLYKHGETAGMWAGRDNFVSVGDRLFDPAAGERRVPFLHWAGLKLGPDAPYWDLWKQARFANAAVNKPLNPMVAGGRQPSLSHRHKPWQRIKDQLLVQVERVLLRRDRFDISDWD